MYSQIDKPAQTPSNVIPFPGQQQEQEPGDQGIEIDISDGDEQPDEEQEPAPGDQDFDDNLAKHLSEQDLAKLGLDLSQAIEEDISSRSQWEKDYKDSLKYLGLREEEKVKPWKGACGVVHPMMLEAIVRFQSRALVKMFPASGAAAIAVKKNKAEITPQVQIEVEKAACGFNDYLKEIMKETALESDRLLFSLADIGYAAKKVYFNPDLGRVTTQFVKAENFYLPYGCSSLETCPRFTEEVRRTQLEVDNLVRSGYYLEAPQISTTEDLGEVESAKTEIVGQTPSDILNDGVRIYETYVDMYFDEDQYSAPKCKPSPYVVSIDKDNLKVLCVKRNWRKEDDKLRSKRVIFVPYFYVPADGSYGLGLVQLVGQLVSGATKILRQMIDAGTLSNLPALFKARDARMSNPNPLAPGEIREVGLDADQLAKAFFPLPFKEPSTVLFQLLELLINEAKSFSSTADLDISASSQNAPVGTTLALIERQTEVQNAVQTRLYSSFGQELSLIASTLDECLPDVYLEIFGRLEQLVGKGNFTICPASDPTSATMAQRVIQLQGIAQMAVQAPQVYDLAALHRTIIAAMGITEAGTIVPDKSQSQPMGLVDEQMAFLSGKPVQCYPFYDHKAHIQAHMALLSDPLYQQIFANSPQAQQIVAAVHSDIAQHVAYDYRNQIEQQLGVQLPPIGQPQPPQVDAALSQLVAKASSQVAQQHAAQAQQMKSAQQQADPAYQLEKEELDIKRQDMQNKHAAKSREIDIKDRAQSEHTKLEVLRIQSAQKTAETAAQGRLASDILSDDRERTAMAQDTGHRLLDHAEHLDNVDLQQQQIDQPEPTQQPS